MSIFQAPEVDMQLTLRQRATYLAHLHKAIFRSYHAQLVPYLTTIIPANGTVVDVGAHAGQFTKIFARLAPRGRVYAFEPSSYARSILSRVCTIRRLRNVAIVPAGLGAAVERLELNIPLKHSGSLGFGSSHLSPDRARESRARAILTETIEVETLDCFAEARGLDSLCFIKADIEGWELNMLHGATKVLRAFRPVLLLEIDDVHLKRAGQSKAALFGFLGEHGYGLRRIEGYEGKSRGQIHLRDDRDDGNFFCFPVENLKSSLSRLSTE
ncbi:MAG: FkbM family methyltransferase [Alphaproteobacteria bacterium]|nr:MAG: FkbM family methyltransferase [Alphaproteobacteria bacterium]